MDWKAVEALAAVACALAALVASFVSISQHAETQKVRTEMQKIRTEIAEAHTASVVARSNERDELRTWINGSFMRAKIVEAELNGMDARIGRIETEVWRAA